MRHTMRRVADRMSVRTKLIAICMASIVAALAVASAGFLAFDYRRMRSGAVDAQVTQARILAGNCTAAISFNDADAAAATLATLAANRSVEAAAVYGESGAVVARFARPGGSAVAPAPDRPPPPGSRLDATTVSTCEPVELNGRRIGWAFVRGDLHELRAHFFNGALVALALMAGTLAAVVPLVARLQRVVSGPILRLTQTARAVTDRQDYAVRVGAGEDAGRTDELGVLVRCFNDMLGQVQRRDADLTAHRATLSAKVEARTAELRRTLADLTAAKERAEAATAAAQAASVAALAASTAKTAFLANMSHEIRTPMTAILGYADVMLAPGQTQSDRVNSLQVIRRNARHLMELINDVLDISKIEAERMTAEREPTDAAQLAVDVAAMLRPRAIAKGLSLCVHFVGAFPRRVRTDPLRLRQVLVNLVGNAIKFTEHGQVDVVVRAERAGGAARVSFDVRDTGIGMTPEQAGRLFQPFTQADGSMSRKFGGTGLGLAISKRLAGLMGGDVTVASAAGQGSTFTATVDGGPADEAGAWASGLNESVLQPAVPDDGDDEVSLAGVRVLLAEDGFDNQKLITLYLTTAGADVTLAENGRLALDQVAASQAPGGRPFDVVLMDMQMPEMDGYSAAAEARRRGVALPIVALTAHAMSDDRARCLAAGCSDYLTKPIDRDLLLRTVMTHLPVADQPVAAPSPPPPPAVAAVPAPAPRPINGVLPRSAKAAEAMRNAIGAFVGRLPERVDHLVRLSADGDLAELKRALHQLKGVGAGFGFPRITELAARAEQAVIAQAAVDRVRADVGELVGMIRGIDGYDGNGGRGRGEPDAAHRG